MRTKTGQTLEALQTYFTSRSLETTTEKESVSLPTTTVFSSPKTFVYQDKRCTTTKNLPVHCRNRLETRTVAGDFNNWMRLG